MKPATNILVVDDEPIVRQSLQIILKHLGHRAELVDSAKAALARLSQSAFDIVITDYSMPDMLGDELVVRIRQLVPDQRIIMATAYVEEYKVFGHPDGRVDALLIKPFSFKDLNEAIERLLLPEPAPERDITLAPH